MLCSVWHIFNINLLITILNKICERCFDLFSNNFSFRIRLQLELHSDLTITWRSSQELNLMVILIKVHSKLFDLRIYSRSKDNIYKSLILYFCVNAQFTRRDTFGRLIIYVSEIVASLIQRASSGILNHFPAFLNGLSMRLCPS